MHTSFLHVCVSGRKLGDTGERDLGQCNQLSHIEPRTWEGPTSPGVRTAAPNTVLTVFQHSLEVLFVFVCLFVRKYGKMVGERKILATTETCRNIPLGALP